MTSKTKPNRFLLIAARLATKGVEEDDKENDLGAIKYYEEADPYFECAIKSVAGDDDKLKAAIMERRKEFQDRVKELKR